MKSRTSIPASLTNCNPDLPPYLSNTEPLEPEEIPLQLSLLTMEVAAQRAALDRLAQLMNYAATMIRPAALDDD